MHANRTSDNEPKVANKQMAHALPSSVGTWDSGISTDSDGCTLISRGWMMRLEPIKHRIARSYSAQHTCRTKAVRQGRWKRVEKWRRVVMQMQKATEQCQVPLWLHHTAHRSENVPNAVTLRARTTIVSSEATEREEISNYFFSDFSLPCLFVTRLLYSYYYHCYYKDNDDTPGKNNQCTPST